MSHYSMIHSTIKGKIFRWHMILEIAVFTKMDGTAKLTTNKCIHCVLWTCERELFCKRVGHSKIINKTVCQAPETLMEVLKV